jgi:PEP-CTERM motif-containing protein
LRNRAVRSFAAILSMLLLTGVPTHAAPIVFTDVVQVLSNSQSSPDLRLRNVPQNPASSANGSLQPTFGRSPMDSSRSINGLETQSDSLLAGITVASDPPTIDIFAGDDVEASICNCGEIIAAGAWPKWPLLFLATIPLIFINHCDKCDDSPLPPSTPTPTPPSQVPEPVSLLLFGTGLAAFGTQLRRRYLHSQLTVKKHGTKEDA